MICTCEACGCEFKKQRGTRGRFCSRTCWGTRMSTNNPSLRSTPDDFWNRVSVGAVDECWEWTGARTSYGYGSVGYQRKSWLAHRLALYLTTNQSPESVCHTCDNPPCCNPNHLFGGTRKDNNEDRHAKGRSRGGANAGPANGMWGKKKAEVVAAAKKRRSEQANVRAAERVR